MKEGLETCSSTQYRPRRGHKKSRNGCMRCKQRKTKCDEMSPRCTRCANQGLCCQYERKFGFSDSGSVKDPEMVPHLQPDNLQSFQMLLIQRQDNVTAMGGTMRSPPTPTLSYAGFQPQLTLEDFKTIISNVHHHTIPDTTHFGLFNHYLTHTSLIIPFDEDDLYALRVGIPNLALYSKPLMRSILALAAVCMSHELLEKGEKDRNKILDLLRIGYRHHRAALLQVQQELPTQYQYDYILANSTIMVFYASTSHCVRIRLAETQTLDDPLPAEFVPAQTQWISLIRAVHLAFNGLFNDPCETANLERLSTESSAAYTHLPNTWPASCINEPLSPENGPRERTKKLLLPILAASAGTALNSLQARVLAVWRSEGHPGRWINPSNIKSTPDLIGDSSIGLNACLMALEALNGIVTEVFAPRNAPPPSTSCSRMFHDGLDTMSLGRLSSVSGWLRNYVARVTSSATGPTPLRRVIMAFLNRVPAEFLILVQSILDSVETPGEVQDVFNLEISNPSPAHRLALDIFAHWLVLVMLLDGVWWIGGIGAWELRRVVSFIRSQGWLDSPEYTGGYWWPESMYNVGKELNDSERYEL